MNVCSPEQLEKAETEYLANRVQSLKDMPGNPYKARVSNIGALSVFLVARDPSPMNSRLCGLKLTSQTVPKKVITQFEKAQVPLYIPVIGKPSDVKTCATAIDAAPLRGWTHGQFVADIKELGGLPTTMTTRRLRASEIQKFVDIHSREFRTSENAIDMTIQMYKGLLMKRQAEAYTVEIDGLPVAVGLIYFASNKIAYLATAATSKYARKRGAHAALISCRIEAARKKGMQYVFSTAGLNSQSRRNLERAGLSLSHVQTILARPSA